MNASKAASELAPAGQPCISQPAAHSNTQVIGA